MSRIGKRPVKIPAGVKVHVADRDVRVEGPKGKLSRRMDPRAGVSVVWGSLHAGSAANVIPDSGQVTGTVRILDAVAWADCESVVRTVVDPAT